MFSYEDRLRAVQLYIKLDQRPQPLLGLEGLVRIGHRGLRQFDLRLRPGVTRQTDEVAHA